MGPETEEGQPLLLPQGCQGEALVLLGQVSWDQNQKEDSLSYFLKAAKVRGSGYLGTSFMGPESEGGQSLSPTSLRLPR
jgi:hypothetical protein